MASVSTTPRHMGILRAFPRVLVRHGVVECYIRECLLVLKLLYLFAVTWTLYRGKFRRKELQGADSWRCGARVCQECCCGYSRPLQQALNIGNVPCHGKSSFRRVYL